MSSHRTSNNGWGSFHEPECRFFEDIREVLEMSKSGLVVLCMGSAERWHLPGLGEDFMWRSFQETVFPTLKEMVKGIPVVDIGLGNSWKGLIGLDMRWGSNLAHQLGAMGITFARGVLVIQDGEVVAAAGNDGWLALDAYDYARSLAECLDRMTEQGDDGVREAATDNAASDVSENDTSDAAWDHKVILAFQMLGLPANATFEEVKSAYRRLCQQFHPDVVLGKGLNPEFTRFAERRFREIRAAYEVLCDAFGQS